MFKLVLDDYRSRFKSALKNIPAPGYTIYLFLLAEPLSFRVSVHSLFSYYSAFIPLFLGFLLSRMYPSQLSKTLLLLPLTDTEKRAYVHTAFRLRIMVPMLLYLSMNGSLIAAGRVSLIRSLCTGLILWPFLFCCNLYCLPGENSPYTVEQNHTLPGNYEIWNIFNQAAGILSIFIITVAIRAGTPFTTFDIIIVCICLLVQFRIFLKFRLTYYQPVMERAIRYENNN